LATGGAYPCFMTQKEMDDIRESQEKSGLPTGIYGEYARDRNLSEEEITALLDAGNIPSIRWYCTGDDSKKVFVKDVARGSIAIPEWNKDEVLIKSADGLPTYHFAHLVDDHFMRTTHAVRDESWLGTAALHVMLFAMMGWDAPLYYHTPTLDKIDEETGNRRKLSKRKDPEFSVANWWLAGWPAEAILEYLFNLIASGYEEEKLKKPETNIWNYPIKIKKMPTSGALFDMKKLEWWAKEFIATMSTDDLTNKVINWANEYSSEWSTRLNGQQDYLHSILSIERENPKRIRKDFITWQQTLEEISYFFDDEFYKQPTESYIAFAQQDNDYENNPQSFRARNYNEIKQWFNSKKLKGSKAGEILTEFLKTFDINDDRNTWWDKIKEILNRVEEKSKDPAESLRVALTGRTNTPDLYSIMQVMDDKRVRERIERCLK
jgi:glutamyl-tRNA synthetase